MKFYDISLIINKDLIIYPGNPSPLITRYASIPKDKVNESLIIIGSHTGTHVDSLLHINNDGESADKLKMDSFYGKCKVFDLTFIEKEIHKENLKNFNIEKEDIILLKTKNSFKAYKEFRKDFIHIKLDAAEYLVERKVKTLGFDFLSVKKFGTDSEVHKTLIENLTLFEGLNLAKVPEGNYTFIGLPLRLSCDGAPARVILVKD